MASLTTETHSYQRAEGPFPQAQYVCDVCYKSPDLVTSICELCQQHINCQHSDCPATLLPNIHGPACFRYNEQEIEPYITMKKAQDLFNNLIRDSFNNNTPLIETLRSWIGGSFLHICYRDQLDIAHSTYSMKEGDLLFSYFGEEFAVESECFALRLETYRTTSMGRPHCVAVLITYQLQEQEGSVPLHVESDRNGIYLFDIERILQQISFEPLPLLPLR